MTAKWLEKDVVLKVYFPKTLEFALAQTGMKGVFGSLNVAQINTVSLHTPSSGAKIHPISFALSIHFQHGSGQFGQ